MNITLSHQAKKFIPRVILRGLKRLLGRSETRIHSDWKILEALDHQSAPHTVFDLGARNGWFTQCWLGWCPNATIYAFEAESNAAKTLSEHYANETRVHVIGLGVGSENTTQTFYRLKGSEVSSSFLEYEPEQWEALQYHPGDVEQQTVGMTTLDSYCQSHSIDGIYLIKIDIQGFELNALKGAESILSKVDHILVESAIKPLYKDAATFTQVFEFLSERGFHLMNFRAWHLSNNVLVETDMLFRRNGLETKIGQNDQAKRQYIGG